MRIAFLTLGCKLNYAETSTYERGFTANGLEVVPWEEQADVYLINTCSVTERAEKKCRNVIRKMHRVSPGARIIVTGCYAELRRNDLLAIDGVSASADSGSSDFRASRSIPSRLRRSTRSRGHGRPRGWQCHHCRLHGHQDCDSSWFTNQ